MAGRAVQHRLAPDRAPGYLGDVCRRNQSLFRPAQYFDVVKRLTPISTPRKDL